MIKQYLLKYDYGDLCHEHNLGDEIQSLAAKQFLSHVDEYVCREKLDEVHEPGRLIMNGWFIHGGHWPPTEVIDPLFIAFHVTRKAKPKIASAESVKYLKKHEPIGCRDQGTADFLEGLGVKSYYSKCLTLTFPRRTQEPKHGNTYIVGVPSHLEKTIPRQIRKNAITVSQKVVLPFAIDHTTKFDLAQSILDEYRDKASLVITTKLHCALPCIAMGIPVVFLRDARKNKKEYRTKIVDDLIGVSLIRTIKLFGVRMGFRNRSINWSPSSVDIEHEKKKLRDKVSEWLEA